MRSRLNVSPPIDHPRLIFAKTSSLWAGAFALSYAKYSVYLRLPAGVLSSPRRLKAGIQVEPRRPVLRVIKVPET